MRSTRPAPWRALPPVVLFALLSAWTADALKGAPPFLDWLSPEARSLSVQTKVFVALVLLALLCATVYWLYRIRRVWRLPPRVLEERPGGVPRKVLVIGLSPPPARVKGFELGTTTSIVLHEDAPGELLKIHSLALAKTDMAGHNWQQSLRAVDHHAKDKLELLIVVPSSGTGGSGHYTDQFRDWMEHYKANGGWKPFAIEVAPAVNYESFADLQDAYMAAIRLAEKEGFGESDVVIDVTAGQKTTSIAAAMVTLTTDANFQYIQTGAPFGPITYSILSEGPRDPGG